MQKIKTLLTVIILAAVLAVPAHADEERTWKEQCEIVADYAEKVMTDRQNGVPMAEAMERADNPVAEKLVIEAYEGIRLNNDIQKTRAVEDFRDRWYLKCVKQIKKKK